MWPLLPLLNVWQEFLAKEQNDLLPAFPDRLPETRTMHAHRAHSLSRHTHQLTIAQLLDKANEPAPHFAQAFLQYFQEKKFFLPFCGKSPLTIEPT